MSRTRIAILGKLSLSEDGGLPYSVSCAKPSSLSQSIRASARSLADRTELVVGDFVVHFDHGVGRYCGMKHIAFSGRPADRADFIERAFAGDDHLFVPVELSHSGQKYKGVDSKPPKLAALGVTREPGPITYWFEALPDAYGWPGLGEFPELAEATDLRPGAYEEWQRACDAYKRALHVDPRYRQAVQEFLERQPKEPQRLHDSAWAHRDKVLGVESSGPEDVRDQGTEILLLKQYVLRQERQFEKVRREVEAPENFERLQDTAREAIPESIRLKASRNVG